jgi:hypothetical protein
LTNTDTGSYPNYPDLTGVDCDPGNKGLKSFPGDSKLGASKLGELRVIPSVRMESRRILDEASVL